jgi:D-alanine-D-alanine ligase
MPEIRCITVLMGGPDAERPISIQSGAQVAAALRRLSGFAVTDHVVDRPDAAALAALLAKDGADVVYPILHGSWGEGGELQSSLDEIGIPYVGSGSEASALAMDKMATKSKAIAIGVRTPAACMVPRDGTIDLPLPFVLKPINEGSSVGVRMVTDLTELAPILDELRASHAGLMAESYVSGRELTVTVLEEETLPLVEIEVSSGFYDYEAKYIRNDTRYTVAPPLPDGIEARMAADSRKLFDALGCRDVARVDWLLDDSASEGPRAWMLEVNTIPGMTSHSLVPMAAAARGIDISELCRRLVESALARGTAPTE